MKVIRLTEWYLGLILFCSATPASAQTDANRQQQAVTLLVKETAWRIFAYLGREDRNRLIAIRLADRLSRCAVDCDPFAVIDEIDRRNGWSNVRARLNTLRREATRYQQLPSTDQKLADDLATALNDFVATNRMANDAYNLTRSDQQAIMEVVNNLLITKPVSGDSVPISQSVSEDSLGTQSVLADSVRMPPVSSSSAYGPEKPPVIRAPPANDPIAVLILLMMGLLVGLGLGAVGVYFGLNQKQQAEASQLRQELNDLKKNLQTPQNQVNQINTLSREVEEKARRYDELTRVMGNPNPLFMFQALKAEANGTDLLTLIRLGKTAPPTAPCNPSLPLVIIPESQLPGVLSEQPAVAPASSSVFFLSMPSEEGIFDALQATPVPSSTTTYRFSLNAKNLNEATFRFEANLDRVERVLTYRQFYIRPACDSTDELLPGQTSVVTVTEGVAMLENGQWRVAKKALIKYQ